MPTLASERINLRTTPHAKAMIEQASDLMGVSVSNFVIEQAYQRAIELIEQSNRIALTPNDWQKAIEMLENPSEPNTNMQALFDRGYRAINQ